MPVWNSPWIERRDSNVERSEPEDAPDFAIWDIFIRALIIYASNLYGCIDNLIPFQLMYNTLIYTKK